MHTLSIVKMGLGSSAAILFAGFLAAGPAQASTRESVPCNSAALIAAVTAANTAGGRAVDLAPRCHYALATAISAGRCRDEAAAGHLADRGERQRRHDRRDPCCPRL